jgi:hypothetical protein
VQYNTFINSDFEDAGGGQSHGNIEMVSCALFCGSPSSATSSGTTFGNNQFLDDASSSALITLPNTAYNVGNLPPAVSYQYSSANKWKTGYAEGFLGVTNTAAPTGTVMAFGLGNGTGVTLAQYDNSAIAGVLTHPALSAFGVVAITSSGLAYTQATNGAGSGAVAALLSTTSPSSVTVPGASDASAVRVGIMLGAVSGGLAPIYVRPSP